jgi:SAM-dependent methyltransferase
MFGIILLILILLILLLLNFDLPRTKIIKFLDPLIYPVSKFRDTHINKYIKKYLKPEWKTVLNFGCGLNTYSETLYELGYEVTAIDINDQGISEVVPVTLYSVTGDIPGNNYDLIIISTVLHHIPYNKQFEILKKLKEKTKNIIILEDYVKDDNIISFFQTSLMCAVTNLSFFNREYCFRSPESWKKIFKNLGYSSMDYQTGQYECYFLQF